MSMTAVNVGCGSQKMRGYINVDANPAVHPDIVAAADALPFEEGSVDLIEAYHVIEHLRPPEAEQSLREWHRVLRPGGKICLECPDLEKIIQWLAATHDYTPYATFGLRDVFGDALTHNPWMSHHWGFTPRTLTRLLRAVGFVDIVCRQARTHHPARDIRVEAIKGDPAPPAPEPARVYWLLCGDRQIASSRLQGYAVHEYLQRRGINSHLVLAPSGPVTDPPWHWENDWRLAKMTAGGIVVIQKLRGRHTLALVQFLRQAGTKVIYVDCDHDPECRIGFECDGVVCPSQRLASYYTAGGAVQVWMIPDPIEIWHDASRIQRRPIDPQRVKVCWFGSKDNWDSLVVVRSVLAEPEFQAFQLITISNHPEATHAWSLDTLRRVSLKCEVGVVPTTADIHQSFKSNNRVTQAMALGLAVVAGGIQAYEDAIVHGRTGLVARSPAEYRAAFRRLLHAEERRRLAVCGHEFALLNFRMEQIGPRWERCLHDLLSGWTAPAWLHMDLSSQERKWAAREVAAMSAIPLLRVGSCRVGRNGAWHTLMRLIPWAMRSAFIRKELARKLYSGLRRHIANRPFLRRRSSVAASARNRALEETPCV
jgi:glycosyltransferase involved in cell wall biosynthesis